MATPARPLPIRTPPHVQSNVEVAADALREAIAKGLIFPGERIKEIPVAEQLGLSRGPIREAMRLLEHDGLLRLIPNKGAVVPETTSDDVLEVYAMRAALGSLALHKLMLSDNAAPTVVLERELSRFERAVARGRAAQAADADLAYQTAIVDSAGLPRVAREFAQLTWQVKVFISTMNIRYDGKLGQMLSEVRELHRAILGGKPVEAERIWREKFERWVKDFIDQMAEGFDRELWIALSTGASASG